MACANTQRPCSDRNCESRPAPYLASLWIPHSNQYGNLFPPPPCQLSTNTHLRQGSWHFLEMAPLFLSYSYSHSHHLHNKMSSPLNINSIAVGRRMEDGTTTNMAGTSAEGQGTGDRIQLRLPVLKMEGQEERAEVP